jgi:hypothetical protein
VSVLLISACGSGSVVTTTTAPATTTTVLVGELAYAYADGDQLSYQISIEQDISMNADGNEIATASEDFPGTAEIAQTIGGSLFYDVSAGPEQGTHTLNITSELDQLEMTGTVNGEPVDPTGDQLDFASIEPIKATLVIDGQGKVLDAEAGGLDLSQMLGDLGALQDLAGGNLGQHLGPPFPGRSLSLGETWTDEQTVEALEQTVTTKASYTVTGRDEIDGHEVFVIESHATTSAFTLDLGQFLASLFGGFAGTAEDQASQAELEATLAQLEFRISVDDVNVTSTTWFDPVAGLVRKAEQASDLAMTMDMAVPDEASGELMEMTMVMDMAQRMSAALDTDSA